ncbi:MAG: GNAT family N-acetyltransferase [Planctomycetes bacterium]|nr:GNAT family N-acetyltransferase [Planctomycetota bacterium]
MPGEIRIRAAGPGDADHVAHFIRELARFERLEHTIDVDAARIAAQLAADSPPFAVLLAELADEPVGFALYFPTYSTFRTQPCLWLEDLFVLPEHRSRGIGLALLRALAAEALARGCPRLDWCVLDWNTEAIAFYERHGARIMADWRVVRLEGEALSRVAAAQG